MFFVFYSTFFSVKMRLLDVLVSGDFVVSSGVLLIYIFTRNIGM